ncbi:PaaI family thioesterase [Berryella wangjianweii]|uniref:PaaI family thioesterase n=1 Tax=Berryella wangjianweii TaxID=2734634 RepID=UPI0021BD4786|nr:PaaI family thioesterase [Berryella wangjianweii]
MAFVENLGISFTRSERDVVEGIMPITPEVHQPHGFLHGGATISFLESLASKGAENNTDFSKELPFGIDIHIRHRKSGKSGILHGSATLSHQEDGKQFWYCVAFDDDGDVISEGEILTKIVPLSRLEEKRREREVQKISKSSQ